MLVQTNKLKQCHYDSLARLKDYGLEDYSSEVFLILSKRATLLHPPNHPESFFVIRFEDNIYFEEICMDIHAVYNGARLSNFIETHIPDLRDYAKSQNVKRITFGAFDKGYNPKHPQWKPYYTQYTSLVDDWI